VTGRWFSPETNKTDRHKITEILLKVKFNTINQLISTDQSGMHVHVILDGYLYMFNIYFLNYVCANILNIDINF